MERFVSQYYFNVSKEWHLSERPFLFILVPLSTPSLHALGSTQPSYKSYVFVPHFEASRASYLPIAGSPTFITWEEESPDPFLGLEELFGSGGKVQVDSQSRVMVWEGVQRAVGHGRVEGAGGNVRAIRERKSKEEIAILRCANQVSDLAKRGKSGFGLERFAFAAHPARHPSHIAFDRARHRACRRRLPSS